MSFFDDIEDSQTQICIEVLLGEIEEKDHGAYYQAWYDIILQSLEDFQSEKISNTFLSRVLYTYWQFFPTDKISIATFAVEKMETQTIKQFIYHENRISAYMILNSDTLWRSALFATKDSDFHPKFIKNLSDRLFPCSYMLLKDGVFREDYNVVLLKDMWLWDKSVVVETKYEYFKDLILRYLEEYR